MGNPTVTQPPSTPLHPYHQLKADIQDFEARIPAFMHTYNSDDEEHTLNVKVLQLKLEIERFLRRRTLGLTPEQACDHANFPAGGVSASREAAKKALQQYREAKAAQKVYRCPRCNGSIQILSARCQVAVMYYADRYGNTQIVQPFGSFDWDPTAPAACPECDWEGQAQEAVVQS